MAFFIVSVLCFIYNVSFVLRICVLLMNGWDQVYDLSFGFELINSIEFDIMNVLKAIIFLLYRGDTQ